MRLKNKVAIVTGAGSGFGKGIASTFVKEGANVVLVDINFKAVEMLAKKIGENVLAIEGDVSNNLDVESMIESTIKKWGKLDILVNNAGTTHRNKPITEVSEKEFDHIFSVNVKSISPQRRIKQ